MVNQPASCFAHFIAHKEVSGSAGTPNAIEACGTITSMSSETTYTKGKIVCEIAPISNVVKIRVIDDDSKSAYPTNFTCENGSSIPETTTVYYRKLV